jgi:L-lactate dehydrogenase complex protein LldG
MTTDSSARDSIFRSIKEHLAASVSHDQREADVHHAVSPAISRSIPGNGQSGSLVDIFRESLAAVDGHCILANGEQELVQALQNIILDLQRSGLGCRRIAISDQPVVNRLVMSIDADVDELAVSPGSGDLFQFDVGISTAQGAIAETGTLVLNSSLERHRLISLVPPVHICIIEQASIKRTLGETLADLYNGSTDISSIITFVTGPSRTADIELTLAIGVHGPQELYVIINTGSPLK